jgi:hypothetical protein
MPLPWVDLGSAATLDPALRWPLDEAAGNYRDLGGRGGKAPGVVVGTLARNPVAPPGVWLPGCVGFTGAGYINIWSAALAQANTQQGFSWAFWVRRTANITAGDGMQQICAAGDWAWSIMCGHHSALPYSRGNAISFGYVNVNGNWENSPDNTDLPLNTWWHYVMSWDGYRLGMDRNGVDILSNSGIPLPKNPTSACIGTYPDGTSYRANALQVADLRFYPYRLYESESLALYQSYFTSPARPWIKSGEPGSLVVHLTMDHAASRNVRDSAGNAQGGYVVGGSGPYKTDDPKAGMGYWAFNGSTDYFRLWPNDALNNIRNAWTFAAWVYPTAARTTFNGIITRAYTGSAAIQCLGYGASAGDPVAAPNRLCAATYDGGWAGVSDVTDLPLNTWTHAAATHDGTTLRLYRNGVQVATAATAKNPGPVSTEWFVGKRWDGAGMWPGRLSDVRIYNQTLTPESIKAIYDRASAVQRPWMPVGVVT